MKHITHCGALAFMLAGGMAYAQAPQDTVKQTSKDAVTQAGRSTKNAVKKTESATSKAAKKTARETEKAGKTAANEVKKGINKIK